MDHANILLKIAKLLMLFSIIYFLWITVLSPFLAMLQPPPWQVTFNQTYYSALQNMTSRINDSIINGTQLYLQDINVTILVSSNGTVYVNTSSYTNDRQLVLIYFYNRIGWKYMCINPLLMNKQICNDTYSQLSQQYLERINTTMGMSLALQEVYNVTFIIPMNINGHGGIVRSYTYASNPSDEYLFNLLDTNPAEIYAITNTYETTNAVIDFNESTTKCLRFAIPRFGRIRVNVTMPGPVIHHYVPDQFLNESIVGIDYLYVDYNPYPCCGIPKLDRVEVEVCS